MNNKKKWDVLILSGDLYDIDILSSYISTESLGSISIMIVKSGNLP